jgi:D-serine deaminase-like pyridoxal phosphate-dependent protein
MTAKDQLETPELVVDFDRLARNIHRVAGIAQQSHVALRPHVKTHKTPAIAHKQIAAGAVGITVAKLGEAEVMSAAGIRDIFIAYEIIGEKKIERLMNLAQQITVSVAVDSMKGARPLSRAFHEVGRTLDVLIEIDTGLGRCGVLPLEPALDLSKQVSDLPGLRIRGIFTHEGHAMRADKPEGIGEISRQAGRAMVETANLIRGSGIDIEVVSVGSTPTVMAGDMVDGITEIRPGTYVFYDASGVLMGFVDENDCAATIVATVISRPAPNRAIIDAGSKVLTVSKGDVFGQFVGYGLIKGARGAIIENLNEEHGFVRLSDSDPNLSIGDRVEVIPFHICPVINLFDEMVGVSEERVVARWPILARGKSK